MECEKIMKQKVECVSPGETAARAAARMRDENIGFLPVCDQEGKVVGTVTDRDITIRLVAADKSSQTQVDEIMTRDVVAVHPKDDVEQAHRLMAQHHKSRIMCIDHLGHLMGIISLSDIAQDQRSGPVSETLRAVTQREARP